MYKWNQKNQSKEAARTKKKLNVPRLGYYEDISISCDQGNGRENGSEQALDLSRPLTTIARLPLLLHVLVAVVLIVVVFAFRLVLERRRFVLA